ncbi:MAG: hypothetical protein MRQ11_02885 [Candidatus Midichloria mitochondrii]|nr:hypothetical protein [Candidatus Midichloria mitochondrii]
MFIDRSFKSNKCLWKKRVRVAQKHPQEFAVALRSSIKTSWIMPLKEFFDSTNEVSAFVL